MDPSKKCTKWKVVQPLEAFHLKRSSSKDGRQPRCKSCCKAWYAANRERHIKNVRLRNNEYRKVLWQKVTEYLLENPCVDCGEADLRALEFDHRVGVDKVESIGRMLGNSLPWPRLLEEIEKCDVRCCNCHRIRTGEQFGSWRIAAELARAAALGMQAQEDREVAVARLARLLPQHVG